MNADFVSFSLAKKLKEKGYSQAEMNALAMYNEDGEWYSLSPTLDDFYYDFKDFDENDCVCPTISQVLKWLREEKVISVEPYASASGWRVTICRAYHQDRCDAGGGTCLKREVIGYNDGGAFEKYEEAAIAGIEYVIDNLI